MGIKDRFRALFPPTNRLFCSSIEALGSELNQIKMRQDELTNQLSEMQLNLSKISSNTDLILEVKTKCDEIRSDLEYCNLEYLSKFVQNRTAPRVLIAGWYGASNCGDELMLRAVLSHFDSRGMRVSVLLWDDPNYDIFTLPPFVDVVHYPSSIWHIDQIADAFDAVIWGGGAILDENQFSSNPRNFNTGNLFVRLSVAMLNRGKKVYSLGLSSNKELRSARYLSELNRIICESEYFSLRDEYSFRSLESAGICMDDVDLCEDVVFADKAIPNLSLSRGANDRFRLGVVFICLDSYMEHNELVLKALLKYVAQHNIRCAIDLIPFHDYKQFDSHWLSILKERVGSPDNVKVMHYSSSIEDNAILCCDAAICYRYHAALLAGLVGIPSLLVSNRNHPHYPNKMLHLADLFDYRDHVVDMSDCSSEQLDEQFGKLFFAQRAPEIPADLTVQARKWLSGLCDKVCESMRINTGKEFGDVRGE